MGNYSKDKIYFAWIPVKSNYGWHWLSWVRDVLYSKDGKNYIVVIREPKTWKFVRQLRK